ncbi:MAG: hypothetical protein ABGZ17_13950 [Planctomycetaceae bacterium]
MSTRLGLTLLEVLLATVILAGALAALSQLSTNGVNAALRTDLETTAAVMCQTRLDELLATSEAITTGRKVVFHERPEWSWVAEVSAGPNASLALLAVTVQGSENWNAGARFRLSRLVRRTRLTVGSHAEDAL